MILVYDKQKKLVGGVNKYLFDTMQKTAQINPLLFLTLHRFLHYIGIDPDAEASGFAWWNKREQKLIACTTYKFFDLFDTLKFFTDDNLLIMDTIVHIEGSWLESKANWHNKDREQAKGKGEAIARHVGQNHAVGKLICEMCQSLELSFIVRKIKSPLFVNQEYFQKVTGWKERTNADARSAANYVYSL